MSLTGPQGNMALWQLSKSTHTNILSCKLSMLSVNFTCCLEAFNIVWKLLIFFWKHQCVKVDSILKSYLMFTVAPLLPLVVPPSINWMHALSPPFISANPSEFRSKSSSANQQWEFFWPNTFHEWATQVWDEIYAHRCLSWTKILLQGWGMRAWQE